MSFETRRLRPSAIPIRWRLAGGSAILTLLILLTFAIAVGAVLSETLRTEFNRETADAANTLVASSEVVATPGGYKLRGARIDDFAASQQAKIRVLDLSGNLIDDTPGAPDIGLLPPGEAEVDGYVVETRFVAVEPNGRALLEYARPTRGLDQTIARSRLMLAIGVVGGSLLALAAGLLIARRAMRPITELTSAAREIERTADPGQTIPIPEAEDEVRILAETLQGMLESLEIAQQHTLASLDRQRQFVADASHELRTPLTALLANLELLSDNKDPEVEESTEAAMRSARRMGALVSDLLLLARSDSSKPPLRELDLSKLINEVRHELDPLLGHRTILIESVPLEINGDHEGLLRVIRNLLANAIAHTPDGTHIEVHASSSNDVATIVVDDDGPGITDEKLQSVFDRFIRGGGETDQGSGLGLAIVSAVASSHGGSARAERSPLGGARLIVELPLST